MYLKAKSFHHKKMCNFKYLVLFLHVKSPFPKGYKMAMIKWRRQAKSALSGIMDGKYRSFEFFIKKYTGKPYWRGWLREDLFRELYRDYQNRWAKIITANPSGYGTGIERIFYDLMSVATLEQKVFLKLKFGYDNSNH